MSKNLLPPTKELSPVEKLVVFSRKGKQDEVRTLLKQGVHVDGQITKGITALSAAARRGHEEVCLLLLENKADPNIGREGFTALQIACRYGHEKVRPFRKRSALGARERHSSACICSRGCGPL